MKNINELQEKIMTIVMSVSLFLIGVSTMVTTGANLLGLTLPDIAVRALGIVNILSLITLVYSNVKKLQMQKERLTKGMQHEA